MPTSEELDAAKALLEEEARRAEEKVVFDDRQQKKVEELIKGAKGAAARELRAERDTLKAEAEASKAELAAAKEALEKAKKEGVRSAPSGELERLQAEIAEMKAAQASSKAEKDELRRLAEQKGKEAADARTEAMNDRKRAALTAAATGTGFFKPDMVVALVSDKVRWDDDLSRYVVLNEQGVARMNSTLEPMNLEEFCLEYGKANKFMVRSDFKPGAGSTPSGGVGGTQKIPLEKLFGSKSDGALALRLKKESPSEYAKRRQDAVEAKLL